MSGELQSSVNTLSDKEREEIQAAARVAGETGETHALVVALLRPAFGSKEKSKKTR